jgi:hypothetical protein
MFGRCDPKSLFILSLPRSLSSLAYQVAMRAVELSEPIWTMDGEILNIDRMAHYRGPRIDEGVKFTTREHDPEMFQKLTDFLGEIVVARGFAYKDVVHPFVVSEWWGLKDFNVLKIRRDVSDVACSMFEQGWYYPRDASQFYGDVEMAAIEGLLRAEAALASVPGEVISYDDLIADEQSLARALRRIYPATEISDIHYMDTVFVLGREVQLSRRATARYREIHAKVQAVRAALKDMPGA